MVIGSTNRNFKGKLEGTRLGSNLGRCLPDFLWPGRDLDMNFVFQMRALKPPSVDEYLVKSGASGLNCSQSTSDNQEASIIILVIALSRAVRW